jgi:hypothetical protein
LQCSRDQLKNFLDRPSRLLSSLVYPVRHILLPFFAYAWDSSLRIYHSSFLSCIALHHCIVFMILHSMHIKYSILPLLYFVLSHSVVRWAVRLRSHRPCQHIPFHILSPQSAPVSTPSYLARVIPSLGTLLTSDCLTQFELAFCLLYIALDTCACSFSLAPDPGTLLSHVRCHASVTMVMHV